MCWISASFVDSARWGESRWEKRPKPRDGEPRRLQSFALCLETASSFNNRRLFARARVNNLKERVCRAMRDLESHGLLNCCTRS